MSVWFEDLKGNRYPASRVKRIRKGHEITYSSGMKGTAHYVDLDDEDVVEVSSIYLEDLERAPLSTWAAAPGTYIVSLNGDEVLKWPVIGWSTSADSQVYPITLNGVNQGQTDTAAVLLPSGDVTAYDQSWESLEHWKETQALVQR